MVERKSIDIDYLMVDEENPRFEAVGSESDALFSILEDQTLASGNKILTLARSIAEKGLNASELLVVSPIANADTYRVREGNRRVTAIKLSLYPELIPDDFKALRPHFASLSDLMQQRRAVDCYVTNDDAEIRSILTLRHAGENGGIGVVRWNAVQKERFSRGGNQQTARAISLIESIRKLVGDGELVFTAVGIPATNIGRLISTPEVRDALGISVDGATAHYLGGHDELLLDVLTAVKREGVVPIYRKEDRIRLVEDARLRVEPFRKLQVQLPISEIMYDGEGKQSACGQNDRAYSRGLVKAERLDSAQGVLGGSQRSDDKQLYSPGSSTAATEPEEASLDAPHETSCIGANHNDGGSRGQRRKPVRRTAERRMFGITIRPKGTESNNLYRGIDWIDAQYLKSPDELYHLLPILGFSLRLLMETVAREYYSSQGKDLGDKALSCFIKEVAKPAIKAKLSSAEENELALASQWIDGSLKFEALLAKWAHGTLPVNRSTLVRQSELTALIINETWS